MAVPRFDSPNIAPARRYLPQQNIDTSPDTFGAGVGRALGGFGNAVSQAASLLAANSEKMRNETALAQANDAFVNASVEMGQFTADYLTQEGDNASLGYSDFNKGIAEIRTRALGALEMPEAQAAFDKQFQSRMLADLDQGANHAAQQHKAFLDKQLESRLNLIINDSATNSGNQELFEQNLLTLDEVVDAQAERNGMPPEAADAARQKLKSLAWEARLNGFAQTDPVRAWESFNQIKSEMTVETRASTETALRSKLREQGAAQGADAWMAGGPNGFAMAAGAQGAPVNVEEFLLSRLTPGHSPDHIRKMQPELVNRLGAMISNAPPEIAAGLGVMSGYRSVERQAQLWDQALRKYGSAEAARKWVAPPGRSQHNHGNAADLNWMGGGLGSAPKEVVQWLKANVENYGLKLPLGNENWHVELAETRGGTAGTSVGSFAQRIEYAETGTTNLRTSPAGALGVMQVMPATGRMVAAKLGIPFSERRLLEDDEYNRVIGTAYLNMMLSEFGNETLAAAAYNAGPGAVRKWLKVIGDPRTGEISEAEWALNIPFEETRGYVAKVLGNTGATAPRGPVSAQTAPNDFGVRLSAASAWADTVAPGDSLFKDNVLSKMTTDYNRMKTVDAETQQKAYDAVMSEAISDELPTSKEELLSDDALREAFESLKPDQQRTVLGQLRQNAAQVKDGVAETSAALVEYERIYGLKETDPAAFMKEDIANNKLLTKEYKKQLIDERLKPEDETKKYDIQLPSALALAKARLDALGFDPEDPEFTQFVGALSLRLRKIADENKRSPTDDEMLAVVNKLLTQTQENNRWFWMGPEERYFFQDYPDPRFESFSEEVLRLDAPTIPTDVRENLRSAYVRKHNKEPTEQMLWDFYRQYQKRTQ